MKHGIKPTRKQKILISSTTGPDGNNLIHKNWLVYKDSPTEFHIKNRESGKSFHRPIFK